MKASLKYQKATRIIGAVQETTNFSTETNPSVAPQTSKALTEHAIGTTRYDLQTNQSVQNRIYLFPDGTIGGAFTYGITETSFADRGTGYNYFDGTAWGAYPSARVESARCGWPSYCPMGTGELVVAHNGSTGLLVSKRATKGTGSWTTSTLVGPACSNGTTALLWPRTIVSGNTIHIIACTDQATSPAIWYYQGLALAVVYIRSTDGGATWDAPIILPGMDSASVVNNVGRGFSGDSYSWAAPHGDTIAFAVGDSWQDVYVMKSFNGGTTWTKVPVFNFPDILAFPTPRIPTNDGSLAVAIDHLGKAHVCFGRTAVSKNTANIDSASYYPYTDGLVYWNEDMPVLDTTALGLGTEVIAAMMDYTGNDTIDFPTVPTGTWPFGTYYGSLSSFPQIIIDNNNDIFVSYSACREDKIDATGTKLYRHLYIMKKALSGASWTTPDDLTGNVVHDFDECVFGSMSYTSNNSVHIVYQADDTPGLAVRGDATPYGDNTIYYVGVPKSDIGAVGINENDNAVSMNIYPNPTSDFANIDLNLTKTSNVIVKVINLVGQEVMQKSFGQMSNGNHTLAIAVNQLTSG
ncbi:MAG: T9SS type A sorting domain-containing protein, partial [Bacteroidota bacterium]